MRRIFITGSNRGIGLALVRRGLADGNVVFAACRSPAKAEALRRLKGTHRDKIKVLRLDLLDPDSHEAARKEVEAQAGAIDVLINNAGIYTSDPTVAPERTHHSIRRFDADTSLELIRVNTVAQLSVTRELLPLVEKGDRPRIAFLSSGMGSIARKVRGEVEYSYSASKAALNMFARVLGNELADDGIFVTTLDPGWVSTDMGTSAAPLQPDRVADGLWRVINNLDRSSSGMFLDWRGGVVKW